MATQKNSVSASAHVQNNPTRTAINSGFRMAGAHLFAADMEDSPTVYHMLPFVKKLGDRDWCFWSEPKWTDLDPKFASTEQAHWGIRAAAAWMIYLQQNGEGNTPSLYDIRKAQPAESYAAIEFWGYMQRLLWHFGTGVSVAQIAADVEEFIARADEQNSR